MGSCHASEKLRVSNSSDTWQASHPVPAMISRASCQSCQKSLSQPRKVRSSSCWKAPLSGCRRLQSWEELQRPATEMAQTGILQMSLKLGVKRQQTVMVFTVAAVVSSANATAD